MMLQNSKKRFLGLNADFLGLVSSSLCAVHCMAVPLLSTAGLTTVGHHSHIFDFALLAIGIVFAGFSLVKDFFKHKNAYPLALGVLGFIFLSIGIVNHITALSVIGGIIIAISHFFNYKVNSKSSVA